MNEQLLEVHDTSLSWLHEAIEVVNDLGLDDLTPALVAQFWSAVAQEAACAANIMVKGIESV